MTNTKDKSKVKRQKEFFKSSEIAHVWANQGAPKGRSPGNMSFDGAAFYSYSTIIARIVRAGRKRAYVLDRAQFSISTSNHQGAARAAIPSGEKVFFIQQGQRYQNLKFTPAGLRDFYLSEFKDEGEAAKSKFAHVRANGFLHRVTKLELAIDACKFWGLRFGKLTAKLRSLRRAITAAEIVSDEHSAKLKAAQEKRDATRSERQKRADEFRVAQAIALAESSIKAGVVERDNYQFGYQDCLLKSRPDLKAEIDRLRAERDAKKIEDWLAGDRNAFPSSDWPIMLRREGDEMVTTMGARTPIADAERAFKFCIKSRARGWRRNGEKFSVGMYQLDAVNDVGVIAGCHVVKWTEIERFAKQQGWKQ